MWNLFFIAGVLSCSVAVWGADTAAAQSYPNKFVRVVTGSPGSAAEFPLRVIAPVVSSELGQSIVVDNRPSGVIPGETVSKAAPDGYTLLFYGGTFWMGPLLEKTSYDPIADFSPITMAVMAPVILIVHPSLPVKSVKELIALAKTHPGALNYGSPAIGSEPHLAMELLKSMTGVKIVDVPYKGGGAALNALIAGEVQVTFNTAASVKPQLESGRLRALAVGSAKPSALFPKLPTVGEAVPGFEFEGAMFGLFAPAKTPDAIIKRLNEVFVRALKTPATREKFLNAGLEVVGSTPEEFGTAVKSEMTLLGKVIKDAGIHVN